MYMYKCNYDKKQNRSTEGCSKLKRSVDMTSSGKNGLNIRTNASPKWDRTRIKTFVMTQNSFPDNNFQVFPNNNFKWLKNRIIPLKVIIHYHVDPIIWVQKIDLEEKLAT